MVVMRIRQGSAYGDLEQCLAPNAQTVESASSVGDLGLIPGLGRSPGEENSYPLQYCGLENSMDRGAWQATVHRVEKESDMTEQLSLSL